MRYHGNEGTLTLTGLDAQHLVRWDYNESAAEIDSSKQGEDWSDVDAGQSSGVITATMFLDDAAAMPDAGLTGAVTLVFKTGGTPGQITGNVLLTNVGTKYELNNNVVVDITLKNKGAMAKQTPIA